jgi:uncharacterized MnhB-related membrane protein
MPAEPGVLDAGLALMLVVTALWCLAARALFRAVVVFVSFGLLLALAWARLGAPDLAIAEAAIGAGVTGALLLDALGALARDREPPAGARRDG